MYFTYYLCLEEAAVGSRLDLLITLCSEILTNTNMSSFNL